MALKLTIPAFADGGLIPKLHTCEGADISPSVEWDGEPPTTPLTAWALQHRFTQPGGHQPFGNYTYAEQAPPDETVP